MKAAGTIVQAATLVLVLPISLVLVAQQGTQAPPLVSNVNLVLVPVTVNDQLNRVYSGLEKDFFSLTEDRVAQEIRTFSSEDAPISMGVVFDSSGSMGDKIHRSRDALIQFFKTANPQDEFFLIDFADQPRIICNFTNDVDKIINATMMVQAQGKTALLDAVYLALEQMQHAQYQRKALLIVSDGGDNHSRYTERDVQRVVREADVQIYSLGIFSPAFDRGTSEEMGGPQLLEEITNATGGRSFAIDNLEELPDVAIKIGIELRNEYVLGYYPTNKTPDGKWRRIQVKIHPPVGLPPLTVSARPGYYGPHP